jgi:cytochrome c oxidase assembly protein subunit 15
MAGKLLIFLVRALLVAQAAIVLTGGAVRLTKSGLGCPTWPECAPGSFLPSPHQAEDPLNIWIEFANRLLTFVLFAIALAVVVAVLRTKRKDLRTLALLQVLGILGQGVVGGITVLTKLHPAAVGSHFILSIALIGGAVALVERAKGYPTRSEVAPVARNLVRGLLLLCVLVITLGIVVTGSGPHAGDLASPRFGFDIRTVAWLHADVVIAFVGLLVGYLLLLQFAPVIKDGEGGAAKSARNREARTLLLITLAQGVIGYTQYFTGVPELLVMAHLLGVVVLWSALVRHAIRVRAFSKQRQVHNS